MLTIAVHNLQRGGAWRRLSSQMRHLSGTVMEVCLETAEPITPGARVIPFKPRAPKLCRAARPPARYTDHLALELAWRRAAQTIRELDPDLVYVNPCRYLQTPPIASRGLPPTVYFCDEPRRVDNEHQAAESRNRMTRLLYQPVYARERYLDRAGVAVVDAIVTNSRYTAEQIQLAYGRAAGVIAMGVADTLLEPSGPARPNHVLLSVGSLIPSKGHEHVIRAAAESGARPSVRIIAPRQGAEEQARLEGIARSLSVDLQVDIGISDQELAASYASAFVTLYLADHEPFGLVSLEAQASGCPVIVSDEGGLPETIVEGITGWSVPVEPVRVAGLIDRFHESGARARMSAAARQHAARYTWKASAEALEAVFESTLNSRS